MKWLRRGMLMLLGLALGLGAAELYLRWKQPAKLALTGLEFRHGQNDRLHPKAGIYELDEELGYAPVLGGPLMDERGAHHNEYADACAPGKRRVVFLGDSVTERGKLIEGVRLAYGDEDYEYWNLGVGGWATEQEVRWHERHGRALDADQVVLTFHPNDWMSTPICFLDEEGELVLHHPARTIRWLPADWVRESWLVRLWVSRLMRDEPLMQTRLRAIDAAFEQLAAACAEDGSQLDVLLLPRLEPPEQWTPKEQHMRAEVKRLLDAHGIDHVDLRRPLEIALERGFDVRERPDDWAHPSLAFGRVAGNWLEKRDFLIAAPAQE